MWASVHWCHLRLWNQGRTGDGRAVYVAESVRIWVSWQAPNDEETTEQWSRCGHPEKAPRKEGIARRHGVDSGTENGDRGAAGTDEQKEKATLVKDGQPVGAKKEEALTENPPENGRDKRRKSSGEKQRNRRRIPDGRGTSGISDLAGGISGTAALCNQHPGALRHGGLFPPGGQNGRKTGGSPGNCPVWCRKTICIRS